MTPEQMIGERIQLLRGRKYEGRGMTQVELGKLMSVVGDEDHEWPRQAVWAAERGKRAFTISELINFAKALNVPLAWLLSDIVVPDDGTWRERALEAEDKLNRIKGIMG